MFFCEIEEFFCIDIFWYGIPGFSFSKHLDECPLSGKYLIWSEFVLGSRDTIEETLSLFRKYELRITDNPLTRNTSIIYRVPFYNLRWIAIARIYTESTERIDLICKIESCCLVWILYFSAEIVDIYISSSFEGGDDFFATEITDCIARCELGYEFLEYLSRDEYFPIEIEFFTDFFDLIDRHSLFY